jgi:hypothetical protein
MPILNYTTKISPEKTVSEIQARLVKNGARQLNFDYNDSGELRVLTFRMDFDGNPIYFSLTPNVDGVLEAMKNSGAPRSLLNTEQACRVAWRIEKDWIEAQLAKIESGLATPIQLLLPYAVTKDGSTFYQKIKKNPTNLLL